MNDIKFKLEILDLECNLQKVITKREGMLVANELKKLQGEYPAYYEDDFDRISGDIQDIMNDINNIPIPA